MKFNLLSLLLITLTTTILLLVGHNKVSAVVSQEVKDAFSKADPLVNHINEKEFKSSIKKGAWFVFFGAVWCPHCMKLTPTWLEFQQKGEKDLLEKNFHIVKVECTKNEDLCEDQKIDAFPELKLFFDGKSIGSFDDDVERKWTVADFLVYAHRQADDYLKLSGHKDQPSKHQPMSKPVENNDHEQVLAEKPNSKVVEKNPTSFKYDSVNNVSKSVPVPDKSELKSSPKSIQQENTDDGDDTKLSQAKVLLNKINEEAIKVPDDVNTDGRVVHLTDLNFNSVVNHTNWLVMFHAPWCTHCKNLARVWEQLALSMKNKMNVGKVDCTSETKTCKANNIKGYPTLVLFQDGMFTPYRGYRSFQALSEFANSYIELKPFTIATASNFDSLKKENEVGFYFLYDPSSQYYESSLRSFVDVAKSLRSETKFFVSPDIKVYKSLGVAAREETQLVVVKENGGDIVTYNGPLDDSEISRSHLRKYIKANRHSLVPVMDANNVDQLLGSGQLIVLGIGNGNDQNLRTLLLNTAKKWKARSLDKELKGQSMFVYLDGARWFQYIERVYGISIGDLPRIVVLDPATERFYDLGESGELIELHEQSIAFTVDAVLANKLNPKYTNGFFSATLKKVARNISPYANYMIENPLQGVFIAAIFMTMIVFCVGKLTGDSNDYKGVKYDPKAE